VDLDEKAVDPMIAAEVELRIQALGSLIRLEPARAVPILKEVALNALDIDQARRAMFVLVQSDRTDARAAVAQIAKSGPEPVTIAAVKVLGMSASPETTAVLTDLYFEGTRPVKSQVLRALGAARQPQPLMRIVRTESERPLREIAVAALGQAGARRQLAELYRREPDLKLPVIAALFTASGEDELIAIARTEPDRSLRQQAVARLKLFGTAKARAAVRNLR
jgi:HEAT repeat protein